MVEITPIELRRHHRRARMASLEDYVALGVEQGREDALAVFAGLTLFDADVVSALQQQRMNDRTRRFTEAGVSQDRIDAWRASHDRTLAARLRKIKKRSDVTGI